MVDYFTGYSAHFCANGLWHELRLRVEFDFNWDYPCGSTALWPVMEWSHYFAGCVATANALWLCLANGKFLHLAVYCSRSWYYTTELFWQSHMQKGPTVSAVCGEHAVHH